MTPPVRLLSRSIMDAETLQMMFHPPPLPPVLPSLSVSLSLCLSVSLSLCLSVSLSLSPLLPLLFFCVAFPSAFLSASDCSSPTVYQPTQKPARLGFVFGPSVKPERSSRQGNPIPIRGMPAGDQFNPLIKEA